MQKITVSLCGICLIPFRYVVSKDGSLVILDSQLEDVGTYRAIISNSIGELTVEAALEIYYGELNRFLNAVYCAASFHFQFFCRASLQTWLFQRRHLLHSASLLLHTAVRRRPVPKLHR